MTFHDLFNVYTYSWSILTRDWSVGLVSCYQELFREVRDDILKPPSCLATHIMEGKLFCNYLQTTPNLKKLLTFIQYFCTFVDCLYDFVERKHPCFGFQEFHFLSVAYLVGGVLKHEIQESDIYINPSLKLAETAKTLTYKCSETMRNSI